MGHIIRDLSLIVLTTWLTACAHIQSGERIAAQIRDFDQQGRMSLTYNRDVDRDGIIDQEIEIYAQDQTTLIEYKLDLKTDGILDKHWKEGEGLIIGDYW